MIGSLLPVTVFAQLPIDNWKFDETAGSIAHNSVAGRADGLLPSGASFVPAITNNGVNLPALESVDFGSTTGNFAESDFTIRFWLKTTNTARLAEVLGNRGAQSNCFTPYVDIRLLASGALSFEVTDYNCSGYADAQTDPTAGAVNDGNWHRISAVRSGLTLQMYVDGVLRATATASTIPNVQSLFVQGGRQRGYLHPYVALQRNDR